MSNKPTTAKEWADLQAHCKTLHNIHMRDLFSQDDQRFEKFNLETDGLMLDYSRHRTTDETFKLLMSLAKASDVESAR